MTARKITSITVYWDTQDPFHQGWAYRACHDTGLIASGGINGIADDDLCGAIDEACYELGVDLTHDDFGMQPHVDGGCAKWMDGE